MSKVDLTVIGRITHAHGIKGEVMFASYGGVADFPWDTVTISSSEGARKVKVLRARFHKEGVILLFEGVATRNDAESYIGFDVSVGRDELPELEEDEYYQFDLIGLDVWSDNGEHLGRVKGVISAGGNDVLEVHGNYGEVLLPAGPSCIRNVDLKEKKITVHLLEGLVPGIK